MIVHHYSLFTLGLEQPMLEKIQSTMLKDT